MPEKEKAPVGIIEGVQTINYQLALFRMLNNIPVFARFQWLNHPTVKKVLTKLLRPNVRGRKGYDKAYMFSWLMWKQLMGCTYRDLESITGIDYTTFIKFRRRLSKTNWFEDTFTVLSSFIGRRLHGMSLTLDSSFVETYSGRREDGSGYSGYKEKEGFKLHQFIDYESRLPLLQSVSAGNVHDIVGGQFLLEHAPPDWSVKTFAADKGYDSEYFVKSVLLKWNPKVAIPMRRFHDDGNDLNRKLRGANRSRNPGLYRKRTEIERYFSRKKNVFNLGEEKTRHLENFRDNSCMTSIMEILEWSVKNNVILG